ncbi:HD domain-containing protein [Acerihabitans sp. KWT182]|uniref:HD domain-containing protein n=1 Tax=Acerihabitans sp. KWT182 TaxID=3157919 RepID=A0AAU7QA32_9GAMM
MLQELPALPELAFGELTDVVAFLMEIDKLKNIQRRTKVLGTQRQENTAEHSWHFAVAAMALAPYAGDRVDINRVVQMALVHDIVEIDAGDVLVYDLPGRLAVHAEEEAAAIRLFGLLPEPQRQHFHQLWLEYEAAETADAQFALLLDRLMPVLMNLHNRGQSWVENGIRLEQVLTRNAFIGDVYPELWEHLKGHLTAAQQKGWLK